MTTAFVDFGRSIRPQAAWVAGRLVRVVTLWLGRRRERLALAELDDRLLRDIGIDRSTAMREAGRLPWDGAERPRGRWEGR